MDLLDQHNTYANTPYQGKVFSSKPLAAAMGAELVGPQLSELSDEGLKELKAALFHHKMIFVRQQDMTPETQQALTGRLGEFGTDAYTKGLDGFPEVQPVIKEADTKSRMIFGGGWHTDSPFLSRPPSISILRSVEIPPYGGDTIWYNAALAYQCLSPTLQALLQPLRVHMSAERVIDGMRRAAKSAQAFNSMSDTELDLDIDAMLAGDYHPLVRRHPETQELSLYCDGVYAVGIKGMQRRESDPLLKFLVEHITQELFACRLRWEPNMVAMWDNRLCLHRAFNDYDGYRREMHRTTVKGETPMPA